MLTTSSDKTARLWDVDSHTETATLRGHTSPVLSGAFSPDGRLIATGGGRHDNTVRIWDATSARGLGTLPKQTYVKFASVAFCPAGRARLAVAAGTGFNIWELEAR